MMDKRVTRPSDEPRFGMRTVREPDVTALWDFHRGEAVTVSLLNEIFAETIDLRAFLSGLPVYRLRDILQWARSRRLVYVRGYSTMQKAQLLDEICSRLDVPIILEQVAQLLYMQTRNGGYSKKLGHITGASDDDPRGEEHLT